MFPDDKGTHYILEIVAGDRPGLLAQIAYTLAQANVNVTSAKINTLGERAEDIFLIDGARLHDEHALLKIETTSTTSCSSDGEGRSRLLLAGRRVGKQHFGESEVAHVAHSHRIQDAVQVIAFVLHDAGMETRRLACDRPPLRIEAFIAHAGEARHDPAQARNRQATLPSSSIAGVSGVMRGLTISVYGTGSASG